MDESVTCKMNKLIEMADKNLKVLNRYGLYPKRDAIMGRPNTIKKRKEEIERLREKLPNPPEKMSKWNSEHVG